MERAAPTDDHSGLRPVSELDRRGRYCPLPVPRTERALAGLAAGDELHFYFRHAAPGSERG